ncbi:small nuclear ribonucleoprotein-associated protein B' [Histomonas meleagridis]|uniref:small nuclear ribonucleoprotein-associated protein B' n=1 Tax=Histomonas meleagridis TaxID=135588 RepID=UPI00355A9896|nr:small nuclear ribonucleoprotein-associated protein B' [Histomonas meleagridis]KAH0804317.1 small nuclear ribonucleoprotein-associated protein B' [Histomonas meleagridis]
MSAAPRGSKLAKFLNHRVSVSVNEKRRFIGQLLGFDSHSNIVLKDCEEYRQLKKRKAGEAREVKRNVGLLVLRGESVVHVDVIGPPPPSGNRLAASTASAVLQPGITQDKIVSKGTGITIQKPTNLSNLSKPTQGIGMASTAMSAAPSVLPPSALPQ